MLTSLFDQSIDTERLTDVVDTNKKEYEANLTGIACAIQQQDAEVSMDLPGSFGKDWLIFCPIVDILEGDRITWNEQTYRVMTVDRLDFMGESHMEISMRIFKS